MVCTVWLVSQLLLFAGSCFAEYEPTWDSLDTRPLPSWYDEAKIGIFLHWGVFSVPSFGSEWFWMNWQGSHSPSYEDFMNKNFRPNFTYQDFAPQFTAEFYDPEEWADVFDAAGARYVVLTSKHHEGFTNWPSDYSWNWNSMDVGPKRDLLGDLAHAIRNKTPHIRFGLYHSLYEWFNPLYLKDKKANFTTNTFVMQKTIQELYELINNYEPEVVWSDGDWEAPDWYWNSTVFLSWLFNESPVNDTVVTNDRWGQGVTCLHGSFYTCADRYNPGVLQDHKWENAMTLDKSSWGYRREAKSGDYLTVHELITTMAQTISCGGNLLINVGPTHDGRIPPIMEERLKEMGNWLGINGEAVYSSTPWKHQNDSSTPGVWYTSKNDTVYSWVLTWPEENKLTLDSVVSTNDTVITMLGHGQEPTPLSFQPLQSHGIVVTFPPMSEVSSQWVWVLAMTGVDPV